MRSWITRLSIFLLATSSAGAVTLPQVDVMVLRNPSYATDKPPERYTLRVMQDARRLAKLGDPRSQYNLGVMHYHHADYNKAFYWFRRASQRGNKMAQYNLSLMYANGRGTDRNHDLALGWLRKSAGKGFAPAQFYLGTIYFHGLGVTPDPALEAEWYLKAAKQGYTRAQYNLAVLYHDGTGIPEDKVTAYAWFSAAHAAGFNATDAKRILARRMNDVEIDAATKMGEQFALKYNAD